MSSKPAIDWRVLATAVGLILTIATYIWQQSAWQTTATMRLDALREQIGHVAIQQGKEAESVGTLTTTTGTQLHLIQALQREVERTIRIEEYYHGGVAAEAHSGVPGPGSVP